MNDPGHIRKIVGSPREPVNPLRRAWELRNLMLKLRGGAPPPDDGEWIRKVVGRQKPVQTTSHGLSTEPQKMKYAFLLHGKNFLIDFDGQVEKAGFYTTRRVEADDISKAEQRAIDMLRDDPRLLEMTRNESSDSPMIFVDEIHELDPDADLTDVSGTGFTFYTGDDEDEADG